MAVRRKELLEVVSPTLLQYLCDNAATMVMDKATSVTVSDILASACGDLRPAMTAVAQLANQELVPGGTDGQVSRNTMIQTVLSHKSLLVIAQHSYYVLLELYLLTHSLSVHLSLSLSDSSLFICSFT